MKLNAVEKALMNNPVRAGVQRLYEARLLERLGGRLAGGQALEIGCGRGVGVQLILDRFGADTVVAFDLDPEMVERARPARSRRAVDPRPDQTLGTRRARLLSRPPLVRSCAAPRGSLNRLRRKHPFELGA